MKIIAALVAVFLYTASAHAAEYVDVTATGGGAFSCRVDGVEVSTHTAEYKAAAQAIDLKLLNPDSTVVCEQTKALVASLTAAGADLVAGDPPPPPPPPPVLAQCEDTVDNDGDGETDFPADDGCDSLSDDDETDPVTPPPPPPPPPPSSGLIPDVPFDYGMLPGAVTASSTLPASIAAGDVIALQATSTDDTTITCSGTDSEPAFIVGGVINGTGNGAIINIAGEHCHFVGTTFANAQPRTGGSRHVLSGIEVYGLSKNCSNIGGTEVVVTDSEFHHCRPTGRDAHGIQVSTGARDIWILDSVSHNNSGNGFQATHCRTGGEVDCAAVRPSGIYLRGNEFYENREGNGLKWADNVIFDSNTFHSYRAAQANTEWCFSDGFCGTWNSGSDGAAIVIGADNEHTGLTNVFVINNLIYDTANGLRVEDATAPVIEGNVIENFGGRCLGLDKNGEGIVFRGNTCRNGERGIFQNWRDNFSLDVDANLFEGITGPALEYEQPTVCNASTLTNNMFVNTGAVICGNTQATDSDSVNALPGASGNTYQ